MVFIMNYLGNKINDNNLTFVKSHGNVKNIQLLVIN